MAPLRIAVVLGSKSGPEGEHVARWVLGQAAGRSASYGFIDLGYFPGSDQSGGAALTTDEYETDDYKAWSEEIAAYDGFVFVLPEYIDCTSALLKRASGILFAQWNNKVAAFVAYGTLGSVRAVELMRGTAAELEMASVRQRLHFSVFTDFDKSRTFYPRSHHIQDASVMFDQIEAWAGALKPLRT